MREFPEDDKRRFTPEELREVMKAEQEEVFGQLFSHSHAAAKSTILLNGGAAVAVLAFLGQVLSKGTPSPAIVEGSMNMIPSLASYLMGAFFGSMVVGMAYFSQAGYAREFWIWQGFVPKGTQYLETKAAPFFRVLSILFFILSMAAFLCGGWLASLAMKNAFVELSKSPPACAQLAPAS